MFNSTTSSMQRNVHAKREQRKREGHKRKSYLEVKTLGIIVFPVADCVA
jgi:hypothetical protein